ncbi:MAG TPA: hypothetical protein VLF89_06545 [Candidatus Saccharimonadales bacterium]|nr:hypothetical protein [Candidatus Saccharimonadales bacterium]
MDERKGNHYKEEPLPPQKVIPKLLLGELAVLSGNELQTVDSACLYVPSINLDTSTLQIGIGLIRTPRERIDGKMDI